MRITNGILINNSLNNINNNKTNMDTLNTQLASEKKIQRPSDDPIIAIRALRFRSTLSEINQYLSKNIPDAESWMTETERALENTVKVLSDITEYCNQAVNGYYDTTNKNTIVSQLKAYRDQIYSDANADCAGRTIFTGYKTDGTLTFTSDNEKKYEITQKFNDSAIGTVNKVSNGLDISGINDSTIAGTDISAIKLPTQVTAYRIRLGYDKLEAGSGAVINLTETGESITTVTKTSTDIGSYEPGAGEAYYLADTGELILGKDVYKKLSEAKADSEGNSFKITYTKKDFNKGELDPIQYFDCVDMTDDNPDNWVTYTNRKQDIKYEINFNQDIKINTQGKEVFNQDMTRDLDDIIESVNYAMNVEEKKSRIEKMYNSAKEGSTEQKKYKELLDLCDRELDFAKKNMEKTFTYGLSVFNKHQDSVSLAEADVGARLKRLELNESRLSDQQTTVKKLMSTNEEINVSNIAIKIKEAESIYDASLAAASMVVQKKLLDFL